MKKIVIAILALVMLISVVSCGNSALKDAAGTYPGVKSKFVGDENWVTDEEFSLELKADGTAISMRDGMEYNATWSLEGENFKMTETFLGMSIEYTGTLKDGELIIFNGDPSSDLTYEYVYKK